jgi:hypothetical protein
MKATVWGLVVTAFLGGLIVLGSREFDAALVAYTFATLFAAFGITCRFVTWLQRPPTALYWQRGAQLLFRPGRLGRNLLRGLGRLLADFALNRFIWRRGQLRWAAHWLIMWGCLLAVAITFPLVFGWVDFRTVPGDLGTYQVHVFGIPTQTFPVDSFLGFVVFHALVWASLLVIVGVMLALRRRLRDDGAAALQQFGEDFLPLILLFAISATGLMLTASYTWMKSYAYEFLQVSHAVTVILTLLWLPFGKLFHIFQRPTHLAVACYKDAGAEGEQARCRRCGEPFASRMHVEDLIAVERRLGFRYEVQGQGAGHYQWVCPRCRRALIGLAQGLLWNNATGNDSRADRLAPCPTGPAATA